MQQGTQRARIGEVRRKLTEFEVPTAQMIRRVDEIVGRFERYLENGFDVVDVGDVTGDHVNDFVRAKNANGVPTVATMHVRRTALRMFFRVARMEFGYSGDPTLDMGLPSKSTMAVRPLTEDEIGLGRSFSLHTLSVTR